MEGGGPKKPPAAPAPTGVPGGGAGAGGNSARRPPAPRGARLELDDDTEVPPPGDTEKPPTRSKSAAESATALLTGGATASNARELLTKTAADSRLRAGEMPAEVKESVDYKAFVLELLREGWPYLAAICVAAPLLYLWVSSMMGSGIKLPEQLGRVTGTLTVDGRALPNVVVHFTVIGGEDGEFFGGDKTQRPRDSTGITDDQGRFELMYLPTEGVRGAIVGKHRIWITPLVPTDIAKIPALYQDRTTSGDIREVKESNSPIEIQLSTRGAGGS
jgi:hypothetical protein